MRIEEKPSSLEIFLTTQGKLRRKPFVLRSGLTLLISVLLCVNIWRLIAPIGEGGAHEGVFLPFSFFLMIVIFLFATGCLLAQSIRRLRDANRMPLFSALLIIPGINLLALLWFAVIPSRS